MDNQIGLQALNIVLQ